MVNLRVLKIQMQGDNRQVISVGHAVLIEEGKKVLPEDGIGREADLWKRSHSEESNSESFQNTQGNIKTSKQAVFN